MSEIDNDFIAFAKEHPADVSAIGVKALAENVEQLQARAEAAAEFPGVTYGAIQRALAGHEPQDARIRKALGLPIYHNVVVVVSGDVPPGTQVISAKTCACGRWFIPNTPNRAKCFMCSPFRGKRDQK